MAYMSNIEALQKYFEEGKIIAFAWNNIDFIDGKSEGWHMFCVYENLPCFQPVKLYEGYVRGYEFHKVLTENQNGFWSASEETYKNDNQMVTWKYYCTKEPQRLYWNSTKR